MGIFTSFYTVKINCKYLNENDISLLFQILTILLENYLRSTLVGTRMQPYIFFLNVYLAYKTRLEFYRQCFAIYGCKNPGGLLLIRKLV